MGKGIEGDGKRSGKEGRRKRVKEYPLACTPL